MTTTEEPKKIPIEDLHLDSGSHRNPEDGMCVMEAVAYYNDLPFGDRPDCVCPVLGQVLRGFNDRLGDEERQYLKPYILRVVGTNDGRYGERSWLFIDWVFRTMLPMWLEATRDEKAIEIASQLRALDSINASTARAQRERLTPLLKAALDRAIALALDRDRALGLDLARALDRDRALGLDLARAIAIALDLDLDRARALGLAIARALALAIARALALALARARALALARARARARDLAIDLDSPSPRSAPPEVSASVAGAGDGEVEGLKLRFRQSRLAILDRMIDLPAAEPAPVGKEVTA